jgi:hypothetical protein
MDPNRSCPMVLFHCRMGTNWTGKDPRTSKYVCEVRAAAPVQSYCFIVESELIGPAILTRSKL